MRRASAVLLVLILSTLAAGGVVAAPRGPSSLYTNQECGFSVEEPPTWKQYQRKDSYIAFGGDSYHWVAPAFVLIGPIKSVAQSEGTAEALAQSAAGEICLTCLRDSLVWTDRFIEGSTSVAYTLSATNEKYYGVIVPMYIMRFFVFAPSPAPASSGWTRADLYFEFPQSRLHDLEGDIMKMVRSLKFMRPTRDCWSARGGSVTARLVMPVR